jgi:thiamine-phosphate pyrophosphorylase
MFEIIAVTNRKLCAGGEEKFPERIGVIAAAGVNAVLLREKDLSPAAYEALARDLLPVCARHGVRFILHSFAISSRKRNCRYLHLPWDAFREGSASVPSEITLGVSVHSVEDALYAAEHGAGYLIVGHVFGTDCKKELPGRGLEFLAKVCSTTAIPVYGIGGISENNIAAVLQTGAAGACLMSSLMQCPDPAAYVEALRFKVEQECRRSGQNCSSR